MFFGEADVAESWVCGYGVQGHSEHIWRLGLVMGSHWEEIRDQMKGILREASRSLG